MSMTARVDDYQRRHPAAGFPIAVLYKYFDDGGGYLAALIAYYSFLSLFPLLLLAATILGLVLAGNPDAQQAVLGSALRDFPVIGSQLQQPQRISGGLTGFLVGGLGALYGAMGVGLAVQNAMNTAWLVPKNNRPNPFKARGKALLLLATTGLGVLGTTLLTALGGGAGPLGVGLRVLAVLLAVAINTGVFLLAFRVGTARRLSVRQIAPGALGAAVAWQLLQTFGTQYVGHVVKSTSATNSVFALVLGLIAFLYLAGVAIVLCVEINVVRVDHLYPRALLTPLTDNVELTAGDRVAYAGQAHAQRSKGFEDISVTFDKPPAG